LYVGQLVERIQPRGHPCEFILSGLQLLPDAVIAVDGAARAESVGMYVWSDTSHNVAHV
jgi:hypothetical protein